MTRADRRPDRRAPETVEYASSLIGAGVGIVPRRLRSAVATAVDVDDVEALARRAAVGDQAAFSELVGVLLDPIYRYVAVQVPTIEDAEDITQAIFEALTLKIPTHRPGRVPYLTEAFRTARAATLAANRRRVRVEDLAVADASSGASLEEVAVSREEIRELAEAMAALTPDQRHALALRHGAGLSAETAARVMGRQAGTVRGLTFRAMNALRRTLERRMAR